MIIVGEDYGEGASGHPGTLARLCAEIVDLAARSAARSAEHRAHASRRGFELSEASHTPVMLELRIRACHVTGSLRRARTTCSARDLAPQPHRSGRALQFRPPRRIRPSPSRRRSIKVEQRLPAAREFILPRKAQRDCSPATCSDIGIIVQGGLYNGMLRALERLGLADLFGECRVPMLCLNVTYPLVPEEIRALLRRQESGADRRGRPSRIYRADGRDAMLRRADMQTRALRQGRAAARPANIRPTFCCAASRSSCTEAQARAARWRRCRSPREDARGALACRRSKHSLRDLPPRPPTFCTGCPERPVFSALQADAAGTRQPRISQRRYRLPLLRHCSRRSAWATRFSATACRLRAPPPLARTCRSARSSRDGRRRLLA